ncbi:MAG: inositol monophosphatase [Polyangiaceae bacterium]|nr:inositol monophosphatase [Polyangiaceae bacterium]
MREILTTLALAADRARAILLEHQERGVDVEAKGSAIDLVTRADRESERAILDVIASRHPGVAVLAEESARARGPATGPRFVVDPLDGTTNFAHGVPFFSVSLSYELDGRPVAATVDAPWLEERYAAEQGAGATLDGRPLRVSRREQLSESLLVTGFPYDRREHVDRYLSLWRRALLATHGVLRLGSAALDLCQVAAGRLDGFWEEKLAPWDTSAGTLIVAEAGGRVTTMRGQPHDPYCESVLATNGRIHDACVALLAHPR